MYRFIVVITEGCAWFTSNSVWGSLDLYPDTDKKRSCTVTGRTEMSHIKHETNATKGIRFRTTVADRTQTTRGLANKPGRTHNP